MAELAKKTYRVGYALQPNKVKTLIQPSLINLAKQRGIDLIPIDPQKGLIDQGPFDCIIHKIYDWHWSQQLCEFSSKYPNVTIIDPLDAISRLHNRVSMLQVVTQLKIPQEGTISFGIPKQVLVQDPDLLLTFRENDNVGLPVLAKPLLANGSSDSHQMYLVFNKEGLKQLKPPVVLQEFVNHNGVVFKVYVAGKHVVCVKRRSLPDISEEMMKTSENLLPFSQISNMSGQDQGYESVAKLIDEAEMPPLSFVKEMASGLRQALNLHLFNFDMIRDGRVDRRYIVIDINYFPGYAKIPGYETMLTDFFLDVVLEKQS